MREHSRQRDWGSTPLSRTIMGNLQKHPLKDQSPDIQRLEEAKKEERNYKGKTYQIKIGTAYVTTSKPSKYDALLHEQKAFERRQRNKKFSGR